MLTGSQDEDFKPDMMYALLVLINIFACVSGVVKHVWNTRYGTAIIQSSSNEKVKLTTLRWLDREIILAKYFSDDKIQLLLQMAKNRSYT